jgi:hypothetical protein
MQDAAAAWSPAEPRRPAALFHRTVGDLLAYAAEEGADVPLTGMQQTQHAG